MYTDLEFEPGRPLYLQIKEYLQKLILNGVLQAGSRLPATRELAAILKVGRNSVILAYQYLEDDGFIQTRKGQGAYVTEVHTKAKSGFDLDWAGRTADYARQAVALDIEKKELKWEKGLISFKSIAPDESLFNLEDFKKAFLNKITLQGEKLLNYGYARGYKPLIEYLVQYMKNKGVNPEGKEILITNGFTEAFHLVLMALTSSGAEIVSENPTHNTALKIMKLLGLKITGIPLTETGIDLERLEAALAGRNIKLGYLVPSYHNPTGLVMPLDKRLAVVDLFAKYQVPVIEDGFNEELKFSGSHVAPLLALAGTGNGLIYLGSFSKILFPGLRIGWIMGDSQLISVLESIKRSINIHTSTLDQAILAEYLQSGCFEKYLRKARKVYKEKHETALALARQYIPCRKIWGEGGLHIFIELDGVNARQVLAECYKQGVLFLPGDIFFTDGSGANTFRLGISRVGMPEMEKGFQIIGGVISKLAQ
jgi:Transcriptional regulators containing a DNA-binding HTH domain and an aminotransferase domain (MocR family) and their eukaryotic orthologs